MEMEAAVAVAAAAAAMDLHALSRRELQALCKRNGVRANMTNVAMVEALQSLPSVDGIDEIGTTLFLPTPGRSAMKSALKSAAAGEDQQQHGSPLPRGRRVSVKSPEAIRMDVEEGEEEMKRDLVKEIVRTPGVALRSTSRRARATPAPIPTPAASTVRTTTRKPAERKTEEALPTPATLRRSQRTAAQKAAEPVEEKVSTAKRTTRRSARSRVMIDLDQEAEVAAPPEEKVQEEEPKGVASDEKCDDPEEEATKLLEEGNSKEEEPEQDEEVVSDRRCDDPNVEEVVVVVEEEATKPQEVAGIVEDQELVSVEKSAPVPTTEDSPILGVLSKAEATGPVIEKVEDASVGDGGEGFGEWSPVKEITYEINRASEDKDVAAVEVSEEAVKEDGFVFTGETGGANKMLPAGVTDNEITEEEDLHEEKEVAADEMPQADMTDDETTEEDDLDEETSEEDDLDGEEEEATDEMSQADLTGDEASLEDELDEEKGGASDEMQQADLTDDETTAEIDSIYVTEEENGETDEESDSTEETTEETTKDDDSSGGEDDFSGDLPPEFDHAGNFSDAEADSVSTPPSPEEIQATIASSAAKAAVKSLDDPAITEDLGVSSEEEVSQQADATEEKVSSTLDTIVKSLDDFTITEGQVTEEKNESESVGAKEKKQQLKAGYLHGKSLRKLKAMYKDLIAAKVAAQGKRLPLAELDDNACVDC